MNILLELQSRFAQVLADFTDDPAPFAEMIRSAQDPKFGDFQANCVMPLAKRNGVNPRELALRIVDKLDLSDLCEPVEIAGPGFINLRLKTEYLTNSVNHVANDARLGVASVDQPRTIVIDFSSPNVAKPMHVGHLRSSVIGDALQRLFRFLGHRVISDNHIGDWGTQFGMIIYGYKHFVDVNAYTLNAVGELARLYRLVNTLGDFHEARVKLPQVTDRLQQAEAALQTREADTAADPKELKKELKKLRSEVETQREQLRSLQGKITAVENDFPLLQLAEQHPEIARLAREETAKLHAGDVVNQQLWEQFLPQCLAALQGVYDRLGVKFDHTLGESFYNPLLPEVVSELTEKGLARESDGAKCVFIEGNAAPFIVQKGDGAYTYATTDLATVKYRVEQFQADAALYVVDARQSEHFWLLQETVRRWLSHPIELQHVSFGTVMGDDRRPFKTRSGDTVGLESLLEEAVRRAREIVSTNDDAKQDADGNPAPELDESTRDAIAQIVGIGGIKYADLHHNRESDYIFDWDKMLATTGDTATYMQYAYARIQGIFRKGDVDRQQLFANGAQIILSTPAERGLALKLCRFEETLSAVAREYRPNLLTQYLFELAGELTTFYGQCPVLKAEDDATRRSRLRLVDLAGRVIKQGLELLGIEVCERM